MLLDFSAKKARKGTAFIWNTQIFLQKKCRNVKFLHFFDILMVLISFQHLQR